MFESVQSGLTSPDFDQILARFLARFLARVFGQEFWTRKYSVQFYKDREIQFYRVRRKRIEKPSLFYLVVFLS